MLLPWLQPSFAQLLSQHQQDRLPHALLLQGIKGLGKLAFAQQLGQAVLCLQPQADASACGQCKSCQLLAAGSHPDWQYLTLEEKASVIKVDQVRQLNEFCYKTAQVNGAKIVIIEPAEAMNINAANALLKTLEEPPEGTIIILLSHDSSRLLPTIKSRCQMLNFSVPELSQSQAWLSAQLQQQELNLEVDLLLQAAAFAPLKALDLAQSGDYEQQQAWLLSLQQLALGQTQAIALAASWSKQPLLPQLRMLAVCTADLIQLLSAAQVPLLRYPQMQSLLNQAPALQLVNLYRVLDMCQLSITQLQAGNNPNPQLLLENLLNNFQRCAQGLAPETGLLY